MSEIDHREWLYLQVRNPDGDCMGLMRGPFPNAWIARGGISFVVYREGETRPWTIPDYLRVDMAVRQWFQPGTGIYPCLVTSEDLSTLKKIAGFR
jgi:hypothetical protein